MSRDPEIPGWLAWHTITPDQSVRFHARMRNVSVSSSPMIHADSETELRRKAEEAERHNPALAELNRSGGTSGG